MRRLSAILLAAAVLILSAGCGQKAKLADNFEEKQVLAEAQKVVDMVNNKDYQSFEAICSTQMKAAIPEDKFLEVCEDVASRGEYDSVKKTAVVGQKDKETEEEFAVAILIAEYSEKKVQFTISFNENMELAGLFYK